MVHARFWSGWFVIGVFGVAAMAALAVVPRRSPSKGDSPDRRNDAVAQPAFGVGHLRPVPSEPVDGAGRREQEGQASSAAAATDLDSFARRMIEENHVPSLVPSLDAEELREKLAHDKTTNPLGLKLDSVQERLVLDMVRDDGKTWKKNHEQLEKGFLEVAAPLIARGDHSRYLPPGTDGKSPGTKRSYDSVIKTAVVGAGDGGVYELDLDLRDYPGLLTCFEERNRAAVRIDGILRSFMRDLTIAELRARGGK